MVPNSDTMPGLTAFVRRWDFGDAIGRTAFVAFWEIFHDGVPFVVNEGKAVTVLVHLYFVAGTNPAPARVNLCLLVCVEIARTERWSDCFHVGSQAVENGFSHLFVGVTRGTPLPSIPADVFSDSGDRRRVSRGSHCRAVRSGAVIRCDSRVKTLGVILFDDKAFPFLTFGSRFSLPRLVASCRAGQCVRRSRRRSRLTIAPP